MSESVWDLTDEEIASLNTSLLKDDWLHVLLLLHARQITSTWIVSSGVEETQFEGEIELNLKNGKFTGFEGRFPSWNKANFSIETSLGLQMAEGREFSEAISLVGTTIMDVLLSLPEPINIQPTTTSIDRPLEIPASIPAMLVENLQVNIDEGELLRRYSLNPNIGINWRELPVDIGRIGLPITILRSYRDFQSANTIKTAIGDTSRVTQSMLHLYILHSLGLWSSVNDEIEDNLVEEADEEINEEQLAQLQEMQSLIDNQPAYKIFGLTAPNEVNDQFIDASFRNLSLQWHPDRFQSASRTERHLSTSIFTSLSELYDSLNDDELRTELRKRLDVERRGMQYVSSEDESKSEVLQAQGTFYFRKRKYAEAKEVLDKAYELNPYNWRINTLLVRCMAELKLKPLEEVAEILENNKEARGPDRVELLYQSGIYYFQCDNKVKAYELFAKVVELDESHIDAKRYLHRRKIQNQSTQNSEEETSSGFFGRLFGKK